MTIRNTALLTEVCQRTAAPVVASGGIAHLDDLVALHSSDPVTVYLSAAVRMRACIAVSK